MRRIVFLNQKGGVGKTASTVNVGAALARAGKRVLLVDLDPQAHATLSLGIRPHETAGTVYDVLQGKASISDVVLERHGLQIVPSSLALSGAEFELANAQLREYLLRDALDGVKADFLLIDPPPSLGLLALNALAASGEVVIPLEASFLALEGVGKLLETISVVQKRLNRGLKILGVVVTRLDARRNLSKEVMDRLEAHFGPRLFKTAIRENVALAEAPSHGKPIFGYRPTSHGADDYLALTLEILKREAK